MKAALQIKWKLLFTYIAVVLVCIGVVIAVARQLTISSYSQHVQMMEHMMGGFPYATASNLDEAFRDALNYSLLWGGIAAIVIAVIVSLVISRRLTIPVHNMAAVTGKIAEGDYSQRVDVATGDEIGSLAQSLNMMAASLEESQRMRRELMANIAHELRTPLTSISGYMEALSDGVVPATGETYEMIQNESRRLSRLVDDLQRLSRAESGQESVDLTVIRLSPFLDRIKMKLKPQFLEKNVSLQTDAKPPELELTTDEDKLDQVLVNLLDNALRYTEEGGTVSVTCREAGGQFELQVNDDGRGIAAEHLPHIFERFYRADKSRSREEGGSGIGLTIVKRYVEALGGEIKVESGVRKGTSFILRFPVTR